jgi:hypothetical protein
VSDQAEHQNGAEGVAEAATQVSTDEPAGEGAHPRRPTSLRDPSGPAADVPRRRLTSSGFPSSPEFPASPVQSPVSEAGQTGNLGQMSGPGSPLREKLPKVSVDPMAIEQLKTLVNQRPEVGLGLAFAGGLVIATILKRLGRR